ncbi:hypothetical protein OE88DRAFT_1727887 [Heliocybe sulcata]|uniref:Uncharacterized protein n=1 Tax=Heliocybe sulcata TaxID=5364 RepID=A0A5C3MTX8_9AGAM|nr:hypothetical protein OE88DRAFT_1727887 [Heliocybe sulcata]
MVGGFATLESKLKSRISVGHIALGIFIQEMLGLEISGSTTATPTNPAVDQARLWSRPIKSSAYDLDILKPRIAPSNLLPLVCYDSHRGPVSLGKSLHLASVKFSFRVARVNASETSDFLEPAERGELTSAQMLLPMYRGATLVTTAQPRTPRLLSSRQTLGICIDLPSSWTTNCASCKVPTRSLPDDGQMRKYQTPPGNRPSFVRRSGVTARSRRPSPTVLSPMPSTLELALALANRCGSPGSDRNGAVPRCLKRRLCYALLWIILRTVPGYELRRQTSNYKFLLPGIQRLVPFGYPVWTSCMFYIHSTCLVLPRYNYIPHQRTT